MHIRGEQFGEERKGEGHGEERMIVTCNAPDPSEDAVQVLLHLHQGPCVDKEVFIHLLQTHVGKSVEVYQHLVRFLKAVQPRMRPNSQYTPSVVYNDLKHAELGIFNTLMLVSLAFQARSGCLHVSLGLDNGVNVLRVDHAQHPVTEHP